jgi:peptidoglycan/xylan/chitin deacetylase (PgdA/CDA1 family)
VGTPAANAVFCYDRMVMTGNFKFGGKRELLARGLYWSGVAFLLSHLPAHDSLLVLNYHRIGNADDDLFDPGVFSATADQFDDQISYLKKHDLLVTLDEALAFIEGENTDKSRRFRVLVTFDDGYLDNYKIAYPILRAHGAQGVFFLATSLVGSCKVPWWDHIAYLVKTARRRRFSLHYPAELVVDIDKTGLSESLRVIQMLYKQPENLDSTRFIRELKEESKGEEPSKTLRRFLNWDEARDMIMGGMAIGSHTHSHTVLSQLELEQQFEELSKSRAILKEQLGVEADVLAYPVGRRTSFTEKTQMLAREAGYRAAFSVYEEINIKGKIVPYNVKRISLGNPSRSLFRAQIAVCRVTGSYWP